MQRESAKRRLQPEPSWHLKNIQEAMALELMGDVAGKRVAEIRGIDSRMLPLIPEAAERYTIDRTPRGADVTAPVTGDAAREVQSIKGAVGDPLAWPANYFDVLYSVSVVHGVGSGDLPAFFGDCWRLLKAGGKMIHLIDVYVHDNSATEHGTMDRVRRLLTGFDGFVPDGPMMTERDLRFSCALATNPDDSMYSWNQYAPALAELRTVAQACTLVMSARKLP